MGKKSKKWGRWIAIGQAIGEGGQGRVYPVRDSENEYSGALVLKRLKNPHRIERFRHEIETIVRIQHANVMDLVD